MKKIFLIVATALIFFTPARSSAADVWVDYWNSEGVDIYVVDETIIKISDYTAFSVTTKKVADGQLKQVTKWTFGKSPANGMWRYETSEMDGEHFTAVLYRNRIFEFCMKNLGWGYKIEDMWYY